MEKNNNQSKETQSPIIEEIVKEFDKDFGKLKDGCEPGDESSIGESAGCDDCEINQKTRENHKKFLIKSLQRVQEEERKKYQELIYAVENKYEGETRYETALRLIKENQISNEESKILKK